MDEPERKQRGLLAWLASRTWQFWLAVAINLPVLYVLSFGPACWITSQTGFYNEMPVPVPVPVAHWAMSVYWPLGWLADRSETEGWLGWWMKAGLPEGRSAVVPTLPGGGSPTVVTNDPATHR